jgi:hypothetical protein
LGRRGVVWDREGEEGMRVIQRKGKGTEGEGREGRKEEDDLAPPKKIPGSATARDFRVLKFFKQKFYYNVFTSLFLLYIGVMYTISDSKNSIRDEVTIGQKNKRSASVVRS